jgi:hypothetical protein
VSAEHTEHNEHGTVRFDKSLPNLRTLFWGWVGVVVTAVSFAALMWGVMWMVVDYNAARDTPVSPLAEKYARSAPPEPRLQADPALDLEMLHARENAVLEHYAWVDKNAGTARVPVERAMELMLKKGFPARPAGGAR